MEASRKKCRLCGFESFVCGCPKVITDPVIIEIAGEMMSRDTAEKLICELRAAIAAKDAEIREDTARMLAACERIWPDSNGLNFGCDSWDQVADRRGANAMNHYRIITINLFDAKLTIQSHELESSTALDCVPQVSTIWGTSSMICRPEDYARAKSELIIKIITAIEREEARQEVIKRELRAMLEAL